MKVLLLTILIFTNLFAQTYTFSGGKNNVVQMMASKILQKAYAKADIEIDAMFLPLQESLEQSNQGITDGELARIEKITEFYPNLRLIPVSISTVQAVAFSTTQDLHIRDWNDLQGQNFTIVKGAKFIEIATKKMNKQYVHSLEEAFENLENGKTDIIVIPKKAAIRLILKQEFKNIKPISGTLQELELFHFVHKKNASLIPIITPILQEMKDNGEILYMNNSFLRGVTH